MQPLLCALLAASVAAMAQPSLAQSVSGSAASAPAAGDWWCPDAADLRRQPLHIPDDQVAAMPASDAVVRVRMDFASVDAGPVPSVIFSSGTAGFAQAVMDHVRHYRLSCFGKASAPWSGVQEFQFVPGEVPKLLEGRVRPAVPDPLPTAGCWAGIGGAPKWTGGGVKWQLTGGAGLDRARSGIVIVRLRFEKPDAGPDVRVLFSNAGSVFEEEVRRHVRDYRWTCATADRPSIEASRVFKLELNDGSDGRVSYPLTLQQLVGAVDKIDAHRIRFDFRSMQCPFTTQFDYLQPYASNSVAAGPGDAIQRASFHEWLGGLVFKPALTAGDKLVGRTFVVSVPCAVLDLH